MVHTHSHSHIYTYLVAFGRHSVRRMEEQLFGLYLATVAEAVKGREKDEQEE